MPKPGRVHFMLSDKPIPKVLVLVYFRNHAGHCSTRILLVRIGLKFDLRPWSTESVIWTHCQVSFQAMSYRHGFICLMNASFPDSEYFTAADFPHIYQQ